MSKKKNKPQNNNSNEKNTINEIISEDKNNIEDASTKAIQDVTSVVYADNLVENVSSSKSIRKLNIEESSETEKIEKEENKEEIIDKNNNEESENTEKNDNLNENKKNKDYKLPLIISISIFVIFILLLLFSTVFALVNKNNTKIIKGVTIGNIDVSGLSKEEALDKITNNYDKKIEQTITLKHNDIETIVTPKQFDVNFEINNAVEMAYLKGRDGNIFKNNYEILISLLVGIKVNPGFSYNEETFNTLVSELQTTFPDKLVEPSYYIEDANLILTKGEDGVVINNEKLKDKITYTINNLEEKEIKIDIPVEHKKASTLDIQKVYNEVCRQPKDAYYTTDPYAIYAHVDGIEFDISLEEAIKLYNSCEESCSIPLKLISPNITIKDLGVEAFPDLLASYSTTFSTRNTNRSTNIRLASQKINGIVIMPGEVFSYNTTVGKRTAAAGYKSAAVYVGGEVTNGIGGGICQVSSTLYNSVLLANLEIVARDNHCFNPGYVPVSRDATVSWGGPDFQFKNNRNYPIKIVCTGTGGVVKTQIYGFKEENDYQVEIQSYVIRYIPYSTIEKEDPNLAKGQKVVLQNGSAGCKSVAYRILKQNGKVVSKTLLSQDTYNPHNKIVSVGTKEEQ